MMDWITSPWPWYVSGPIIAFSMALMLVIGKRLGISSNFQTLCAIGGAGKISEYFRLDWHERKWNLMFLLGTILGGAISHFLMRPDTGVALNESTVERLQSYGMENPASHYAPPELYGPEVWSNPLMLLVILVGGLFVGFGTRYADGCTSGHAISGLSSLQLPSLIAVIGFFAGGLAITHFALPSLIPFFAN